MTERYKRQMIMPEINPIGQQKLAAARALVVGAGGLGSPVLYYLAAAGVGHIHIVDSDIVEISNLNRQTIHFERDIGREKSLSAKEKLGQFNSEIELSSSTLHFSEDNVRDNISGFDIVLSCVDNLQTRAVLNKGCVRCRIPMVDGGVQGFEGYVMTVLPGITPCYRCIFPGEHQTTAMIGVLGATAGVVGSIMAVQAIKVLLGIRKGLEFLTIDFHSLVFMPVQTKINPSCPVCQKDKPEHGRE